MDLSAVTAALSPAQIFSVVESDARINIWEGAVRSGKTIASLLRWLLFVATAPATGQLVMVGRTRDSIFRNAILPLQDPSIFGMLARQIHYTPGAATAVILGRIVHVIGANDAKAEPKIRGLTCAGAYVDEATVLPQQFFDQLNARCSVPGARLFLTTNPDNPSHWLRKLYILRPAETASRTWHFTLDDNPHLDAGYVQTLKSTYVGLWYRRFILGEWIAAEGAIYDMWDERTHVVDRLPGIARRLAIGVDYGTTNAFAALALDQGDNGRLYLSREWRYDSRLSRRSLTDAEYSERLRAWCPPERRPAYFLIDPSAASFRTQMQVDGWVSGAADNDVVNGIRTVAALLATGRLFVHRSCTGWIDEIGGYSWDDAKAELGEDVPIKANDHSLDAGRYAIYTTLPAWRHLIPAT